MDRMFINPILSYNNLDRYYIRRQIFSFINQTLPLIKGNLLDVGCGKMPYREHILINSNIKKYIGLDIETAIIYDHNIKPDITWNGIEIPSNENQFETVMATEVLEHCPYPSDTLKEINRVMKPGGIFFFTVPFLWNLHETPHDEFRYTPFSLERLLKDAGFVKVKLEATGGWHASMAQMLGLWICRAPINGKIRRVLKFFIMPLYKKLLKIDKMSSPFNEGKMITGICGIAFKR